MNFNLDLRKLCTLTRKAIAINRIPARNHASKPSVILGIETSCDDTGCAIIDTNGNILGEALNSQHLIHLRNGGIMPPLAQELHRKNIETVVHTALEQSHLNFSEIDAIATTVKPGLPLSLTIGTKYGKYLCYKHEKPFIPIHHMEAHALTARLHDPSIQFPFLVLLISGGHCLLAIAQDVNTFLLLGSSLDDAPGEAFDKVARRLRLKNLPEYSTLNGGQAIELAASKATDFSQFEFTIPLTQRRDCMFSVAGIKTQARLHIEQQEKTHNVAPDAVIPDVANLCAAFQMVLTRHLCHRVQRGMVFAQRNQLIPEDKQTLVVSGGAACNNFIATGLQMVCEELEYKLVRPPPKLCTDNGVMIAWNGVEKYRKQIDVFSEFEHIQIEKNCPLGTNMEKAVTLENITCKWVKLTKLNAAYG